MKGGAFNQLVLGFADCVMHKLAAKGPQSHPDGNMGTRWHNDQDRAARSQNRRTVAKGIADQFRGFPGARIL